MTARSTAILPRERKSESETPRFRKKQILFLLETSTSYGRDLLSGAARYANERNEWNYLIFPRGITETPNFIKDWHGDGVLTRTPDKKTLEVIRRFDCPVVELMNNVKKADVFCDERAIARLALDHFEEHCFENVGFFSFGRTLWISERERCFKEEAAVRRFRPHILTDRLLRKDPSWYPVWSEEYHPVLKAWLERIPKPIAVLAANDHQAVHLINLCNNMGYRIPDEVAVLGVNNDTHLCGILSPALSSIDQNASEIGYEAARLLDKKIKGEYCAGYEKRISPLRVIKRQSTDVFALTNPDVSHALHFIREFATTGIRVADVLSEVNLTNRTLERYFKESLGHTPEREILLTKIRHASWLLVSSNLSGHQIADLSGFSNNHYFCHMFKKEMGMTPQHYRRQNKSSGTIAWDDSDSSEK